MSRRVISVVVPVLALALSACAGNNGSTPVLPDLLSYKPSWGTLNSTGDAELESSKPVAPEDLVDASGQCAGGAIAQPAEATTAAPAAQPVVGGVALGMTECQVARRAGVPATVDIAADAGGERKVVLTYPSGNWPGIYTFVGGRLKEAQRVAEPQQPKPIKKKAARKPKAA